MVEDWGGGKCRIEVGGMDGEKIRIEPLKEGGCIANLVPSFLNTLPPRCGRGLYN